MTAVPQGWAIARLDEVTTPRGEKADPASLGDLPFLGMDHIEANTANLLGSQPVGELKSAVAVFKAGDLLYGRLRPYLNKVHLAVFHGAASAEFIVFPPQPAIEQRYLQCILRSPKYRAIADQRSTGDRPRVKFEDVGDYEIPLPPLREQRRIVHKLDTLGARSTTARTHLTAIEKLVERYRTAVLEAAFRVAWDAGCNNTIAGCLEHAETGLVRSKAEQTADEGYPYIRMNHYDLAGRWNDRDLTYVAATSSEFARYQLRANDLLFNTRNSAELVGKVAIWPEGKDGYLFNNNLLRMRFSADVLPGFAFWQMSSPPFRRYIEGFISATTSVAAIYQRSLMAAPFWVPDTDEQREIVRRIETAFAKIDRLAAEAEKALKLLVHLDQRILAKAFAGDLVPQDPTDEPAETLLARIREERTAEAKSTPRRNRKSPKPQPPHSG